MKAPFFLQRDLHVAAAGDSARKIQVDSGVSFQNLGLLCWCNAELNGHRILIFGINPGASSAPFLPGYRFFHSRFGIQGEKTGAMHPLPSGAFGLGGWDTFLH